MQILYAATLFLSAALLFVVQPMFAKMVLPLFGGTPAVWNTCMLFYQASLLGGYVYAHLSTKLLGPRRQAVLHLAILCLPWLVLPIGVATSWAPPPEANPVPWLLALLAVSVGLPFLVVSATAPLLQAWFADTGHRSAHDPYYLYAASNIGSMIALLGYPVLIEPHLTLSGQRTVWTFGFAGLGLLMAACSATLWLSRKGPVRPGSVPSDPGTGSFFGPDTGATSGGLVAAEKCACPLTAAQRGTVPFSSNENWDSPRVGDSRLPTPDLRLSTLNSQPSTLPRLRWLVLSLVPSSLLLGVTTHISTDLISAPLLWVIPFTLYLLSFVLVFARRPLLPHRWMVAIQPFFVLPLVAWMFLSGATINYLVIPLHLATFFVTAMVCHGELAASRPSTRYLTEFYLWMSLGGVLGGFFNAILAPLLFTSIVEYPLMLVLACALRPAPGPGLGECVAGWIAWLRSRPWSPDGAPMNAAARTGLLDVALPLPVMAVLCAGGWFVQYELVGPEVQSAFTLCTALLIVLGTVVSLRLVKPPFRAAMCLICLVLLGCLLLFASGWVAKNTPFPDYGPQPPRHITQKAYTTCTAVLIALGALVCLRLVRRPLRFGVGVACLTLLGYFLAHSSQDTVLMAKRSFFGMLRVRDATWKINDEDCHVHTLSHGSTTHGIQILTKERWFRDRPSSYYYRSGPLGQVIQAVYAKRPHVEMGVIGLGAGTIAGYGQPGWHLTFYEIDPAVEQVARDRHCFTYLTDCKARLDVVLGDARRMLEGARHGQYDVLIFDAYSSDAIPMHLVTREALQLYLDKLAPHGILVFHISNRYFKLEPVMGRLAADAGLVCRAQFDDRVSGREELEGKYRSHWVIMARQGDDLGPLLADKRWDAIDVPAGAPFWTDDFSNVLSVLNLQDLNLAAQCRRWWSELFPPKE